jgi:hypothetical protein
MKWVRNRNAFCRILDHRRSASSPLHREVTVTIPKGQSLKRSRIEDDETHSAIAPVTPPLTASPPVDDMADERTALRYAAMWFLESIVTKKPANDGEILAIWTAISTVSLDQDGMQYSQVTLSLGYEGERTIYHFPHETLLHES